MRRVVVRRPGGHEALELVEGPDPEPGPGEARVRVSAAGVNFADTLVRLGRYQAAQGLYPITPGFEVAGVVDAVGAGVGRVKPADRVLGITRFGGYASCLALPERQLWRCPDGWTPPECAGLPAAWLTAYHGLFNVAKVEPGERLLVHSAAGGVGTALLQLARVAGCPTVAVVGSPRKAKLCQELGAEAVVVGGGTGLWKEVDRHWPEGFDASFDSNGLTTPRPAFQRLRPGGRLVVYGFAELLPRGTDRPWFPRLALNYLRLPRFSPFELTAANRSVMGFNVVFLFHKLELAERAMGDILRWIAEGRIAKVPVAEFPVERAADAHGALESGQTTGKLVLTF